MYFSGHLHMAEQKHGNLPEPTYGSTVPIRNVALKICRKQWTIERDSKRGSGIYVPMAGHDNDDDDEFSMPYFKLVNIAMCLNYSATLKGYIFNQMVIISIEEQ